MDLVQKSTQALTFLPLFVLIWPTSALFFPTYPDLSETVAKTLVPGTARREGSVAAAVVVDSVGTHLQGFPKVLFWFARPISQAPEELQK